MAHANRFEGVLIGLDELLDTRMATIDLLSTEVARKIISSDNYHKRDVDEFDGINSIEYKIAYADRDNATLRNSVMTNVFLHLKGLVWQLKKQAVTGPMHDGVQLTVNIHPYSLSEEEREELARALQYRINGGDTNAVEQNLLKIEFIDLAPKNLTPAHCKASYGAMYMYNPWHWLNLHFKPEAFESAVRLPEVIIYAPRLFHDGKPDAQTLEQLKMEFEGKAPDPLTFDEMRVSPIAGVTLIDVMYFSSSVRLQRNQATT